MGNINIIVDFSHPTAISNTIRYARIDNVTTPVFTTVTNITQSPYIIQNVPNGKYFIGITPIYADGRTCPEVVQTTDDCGSVTSFSAAMGGSPATDIVVSYTATSEKVRVKIQYPNSGTFLQIYDNGDSIEVTPPPNTYGDYFITIQAVCDETSGFYGPESAPIVVNVPPPNNSNVFNDNVITMTNVTLTATDVTEGTKLLFQIASMPHHFFFGNFYIADGFYSQIVFANTSVALNAATLVTGTGTYNGVVSGNVVYFNDVNVSGGIQITVS